MRKNKIGNKILAMLLAVCMVFTVCYSAVEHMSDIAFANAASVISPNAINLRDDNSIAKIIVSYLDGDNWVEITEENNTSLSVNSSYQLEIFFNNIIVKDLIAADYQMTYDQFPDWFVMTEVGAIMFGEVTVASAVLIDGKIVMDFDKDWVNSHESDDVLSGSFRMYGKIEWRELPADKDDRKYPGVSFEFNFENDIAQKYGSVDIEKPDPNLVEGSDGKYYLEYEITVSSLDTVAVPDITVRDLFSDVSYISGYVGIDAGMNAPSELLPTIDGKAVSNISAVFSKEADGTMVWKIGDLEAAEAHTLKYYAQISESYIDSVISNPIQNRAKVFSGADQAYQKDDDAGSFTPQNIVELQKTAGEPAIDPKGNGTITYTVTVSAPEDNSFDFTGLTFRDSFPEELSYYLSGNNGSTVTVDVDGRTYEVDYTNGSFELSGLSLKKGETITITYTVKVENIFLYNNGEVSLTNTASVSKGSRTLRSGANTKTLEKINSVRKIYGSETSEDKTVEIGESDPVYEYTGGSVANGVNPGSFIIPKGSHKYDVVLNEGGNWDMSSTTMKDSFGGNEHIAYTGYVQIRLYEYSNNNTASLSDGALVNELEASPAAKTIWLKVDELNDFSFTPDQLGVNADKNYTYLLTYYAVTKDMKNVGKLDITNDFELSDKIGYGDGSYFPFPGIHVSTGRVIAGDANYDVEKIGWYYESLKHLYHTEAITSGAYPPTTAIKDGYTEQYKDGAVYWIIRLEGKIQEGSATKTSYGNNNPVLSGFYIIDEPENSIINRDAVVGVFKGPKDFDFTQYASYADFMEEKYPNGGYGSSADKMFKRLIGNPQNDSWFHYSSTAVANPEYEWFASNTKLNGFIFKKEYDLTKTDEAIFIVFRTASNTDYSSDNSAAGTWTNKLSITDNKTTFDANTAQLTYQFKGSLYKESKGAFIFDKSTGKFTHCGDQNTNNAWNVNTWVGKDNLNSSGVYAAWLLNVNWDGSMEGEAYVNDYLPEGMELEYVEVNNFGNSIRSELHNWPTTGYIEELQNAPDWWELSRDQILTANGDRVKDQPITTISYYNPETREIRWHISGLTKNDHYKQYEINFRIICRVTDPELFFTCGSKKYTNYASIWDTETQSDIYMEHADVIIYWNIDKDINKAALPADAVYNGDLITSSYNRLPFILKINPLGLDMTDGDVLPTLIDTMSEGFALIENSLKVTIGDGEDYTAFIYDVKETDGCQTIFISNLPDSTPVTITYDVRLTSAPNPNAPQKISNTAYWQGYDPPDAPQIKDKQFKFTPYGDIFVNKKPSVEIIKVDVTSHSKRLQGAVFEIYEADGDGNLIGDLIASGTTDSYGVYSYDNSDNKLVYGVIYCIKEVTAPSGYKLDDKGRYFVIMNRLDIDPPDHSKDIDLDVWYDDPKYSCVIENDKGTIGVEKTFKNANRQQYIPEEASYDFGLFDVQGNLLETLTIEYTSGGGVNYYLDGQPKNDPCFTKYEPTRRYYIYELDKTGAPIKHGDVCELGGIEFKVTYGDDGSSEAAAGSIIKITNQEYASIPLPSTGGTGSMKYYAAGALLLIVSMALVVLQYDPKKRKSA